MRELTIEYVLEGQQRGYNFTSSTQGFNDDTLKSVWRTAMPRGQGWGAYIGAHSYKCFPLADGRIALSDVTVTDQKDESGRAGIRRAQVSVCQPGEYGDLLLKTLKRYPVHIQTEAFRKPGFFEKRRIPKVRGEKQVILSHPYANVTAWQLIEALILKSALEDFQPSWGNRITPFTTLALDYREESTLVVMPEAKASALREPVIRI